MEFPAACPWSDLAPSPLVFCEAPLCAWIRHPANTWSNLAYLAAGALILHRSRGEPPVVRSPGALAIGVGVTSFFFHASGSLLGEWLDLSSMYLISGLMLTINLTRAGRLAPGRWLAFYAALTALSSAALAAAREIGVPLFGAQLLAAGWLEFRLRAGPARAPDYRPLGQAAALFLAAWAIWLLDYHRVVCAPDLHWLQGHAVWHLLTAAALARFHRFYAGALAQKETGPGTRR